MLSSTAMSAAAARAVTFLLLALSLAVCTSDAGATDVQRASGIASDNLAEARGDCGPAILSDPSISTLKAQPLALAAAVGDTTRLSPVLVGTLPAPSVSLVQHPVHEVPASRAPPRP